MKRSSYSRYLVPGVAVLALTLSACGAGNEDDGNAPDVEGAEELSGTLNGAGASTQEAVMGVWRGNFQNAASDVTVNYDPAGSGAGREQFIAGGVQFAGSDAYLDEEELTAATERCNGTTPIEIPSYVAPIAVAYNLPGVEDLQLSGETVAQIFNNQITNWNDPAIAADNPDATLPDLTINPVFRGDASGTTENFTTYLDATTSWPHGPVEDWPATGEAATGTSGVIEVVTGTEGSIGYADGSQVEEAGLSAAAIGVGEEFVAPTPEAAGQILTASTPVPGRDAEVDLAVDIDYTTQESGTYPIVLASYLIACQSYEDSNEAELVKGFLEYILSPEGQESGTQDAGAAPLPDELREKAAAAVEKIS
ncbi:phosphate ABC transporter substrate-binding protein PstS [Nocardioides sp. ChNu-153]|uniref:phosphate ABC transporter substrate-binding protein PstS n=1 Tax=unclassified Nocardioides TaxID=2615069 RepID=UPI00240652AA|nr:MULTISPECIES: phosphate ABC transporter substrate-binding protein PstS [unclassified Nocardioides]MDF9717100.1 phosphate ABC transporter substrate-binding protein PstS [Nocardioides sp. ChNu-99]MDN7121905.1 phosphate ABC transporter substrate-binding protein PstS [Nocardioides sp. ChNu-153]